MDFKEAGDLILVVGTTHAELAGSEYFAHLGLTGNIPPKVDGKMALKTYRALERAMRAGLIRSAHDASDGGIAVTLAESAFAGGLGAEVDLAAVPQAGVFRDDYLLFSESQSRFVVTVREGDLERFEKLFRSVPHAVIGKVTEEDAPQGPGDLRRRYHRLRYGTLERSVACAFHEAVRIELFIGRIGPIRLIGLIKSWAHQKTVP